MVTSRSDVLIWENLQVWRFTPSIPASLRLSSGTPAPQPPHLSPGQHPTPTSCLIRRGIEPVGWLDGRGAGTAPPGDNWGSDGWMWNSCCPCSSGRFCPPPCSDNPLPAPPVISAPAPFLRSLQRLGPLPCSSRGRRLISVGGRRGRRGREAPGAAAHGQVGLHRTMP